MSSQPNTTEAVLLAGIAATQTMAMREGKAPGAALLFLAGYVDRELPQIARALVSLAHVTEGNFLPVQYSTAIAPHSASELRAAMDAAGRGLPKGARP